MKFVDVHHVRGLSTRGKIKKISTTKLASMLMLMLMTMAPSANGKRERHAHGANAVPETGAGQRQEAA